ncbi:MAG: tetratricopeptide repeat protein, partial [Ktedonobacterales bacterium]|nr:tetratricopeptide repeat protein [Ktedonobacterales bacterium]
LSSLGQIAQRRGKLDEAEQLYRHGLAILREVQDMLDQAVLLEILGELVAGKGDREEGCAMLGEAARLYDEMGVPGGDEVRATAQRLGCG